MTTLHSTMTRKGQVTIPAALRHSFGFREGAAVEFFSTGEFVGVRPVQSSGQVPKSGFGMVKSKKKHAPADFDVASLLAK
jgi:AbrB family looped-hinge helix DNA binding protein